MVDITISGQENIATNYTAQHQENPTSVPIMLIQDKLLSAEVQ